MFITIVLNTEYMDYSSRIKWYLKNLLHSKENGWLLITHEYLYKNLDKLQENVSDRFFNEFEMSRFTLEEAKDVEQYLIPDEVFEVKEKECGSRTEMLFELTKNRFLEFEVHIKKAIDQIQEKYPNEKIEGIFHCLEGFESLRHISKEYNIPFIPYVFSAIRKVHGYRQTLFSANIEGKLYCADECKRKYERFNNENAKLPVFDNREIIALLGKERTLPLINLLNYPPKYEMYVCGDGFLMLPHIFEFTHYTDEDIYYECNRLFPHNMIRYRQHPMQLNQIKIDYSEVRSDPASLILSCKRVTAVGSQIVLKAMLWNRTAVMKKDTLPFSFMCEKNYSSETKVDLGFLNYYIFCYLIPSELMFNQEYWRWRLTSPSETEVYNKHLNCHLNKLNIDARILSETDENTRFKLLLEARNCDSDLIDILLSEDNITEVNFDAATSKLVVEYQQGTDTISKNIWRLNECNNDTIRSKFSVDVSGKVSRIFFHPLDDKAGLVEIVRINIISNKKIIKTITCKPDLSFYPKNIGNFEINFPESLSLEFEIECIWKYETIKNGLYHTKK